MKKRGFTLIELMVVIVIIGILAAIAIPKLFGMTAKAKASEVGPAVGTWSKMEQAYKMETSSLGNWATIGYKAPSGEHGTSTTNFTYNDEDYATANPAATAHWEAKVKTGIVLSGNCKDGETWKATFQLGNEQPDTPVISNTDCANLTPNFKNLK